MAFAAPSSRTRLFLGSILVGLGPLLRPELLLLAALAGPMLLFRSWKHLHPQPPARRWLVLGVAGLVMVLPVLAWSSYALHTFGTLIPNTNAAKRGGSLAQVGERLVLVYGLGFPVTLALLPVMVARQKLTDIPRAIGVLLLWPLLSMAFYLADHTIVQTRYCLLSMSCVTLALLGWMASTKREALLKGMVAATLLTSGAVILLTVVPQVANKEAGVRAFSAMSTAIRDKVPAHEPVAVYAIGLIAFESRHPLIDLGGSSSPGR